MEQIRNAGVVPVVVLDDAKDAVLTAKALLAGGERFCLRCDLISRCNHLPSRTPGDAKHVYAEK